MKIGLQEAVRTLVIIKSIWTCMSEQASAAKRAFRWKLEKSFSFFANIFSKLLFSPSTEKSHSKMLEPSKKMVSPSCYFKLGT